MHGELAGPGHVAGVGSKKKPVTSIIRPSSAWHAVLAGADDDVRSDLLPLGQRAVVIHGDRADLEAMTREAALERAHVGGERREAVELDGSVRDR